MARIFTSSVIDAPVDRVWARIRDFNGLPAWNPNVRSSQIEAGLPGDSVGCVRRFSLVDGGELREKLLELSDCRRSCTYSILESPMPVEGCAPSMRLLSVPCGKRMSLTTGRPSLRSVAPA